MRRSVDTAYCQFFPNLTTGTNGNAIGYFAVKRRRKPMPVLLLWAVPAVVVIGGAGYWIVHMH
jgi:hypothetical protein